MSAAVLGTAPLDWSLSIDDEGQREYTVIWQVQTTSAADGPDIALTASGLPTPGAYFAIGNSTDTYATYQRKGSSKLRNPRDKRTIWDVTTTYQTKPIQRCNTNTVGDPLLEPHKVSGGFNKFQREAIKDYLGKPITNSANERITGPLVEIDDNRPVVNIEMNVSWVNLSFLADYVDAVNNATWWGMAARTIKCSEFNWERVLYGTCNYYFHVSFAFELKADTWDVVYLDEGTRTMIVGSSPAAYKRATDRYENPVRVLLNGSGAETATETFLTKRIMKERTFSTVGWPVTLM